MYLKRYLTVFLFILIFSLEIHAQFAVNFPSTRAVFQRNNTNNGIITTHGFIGGDVDKVEGRLVPINFTQGTQTDWQLIALDASGKAFSGGIQGKGGWYNLELRAVKDNIALYYQTIEKVGIGEVFIVSGQSNAQGFLRFNPRGASDDRVNIYSYYKEDFINENPPIAQFAHADFNKNIGPHGQSAWCWGELGDQIAAQYNVPVLFFNTAFEGTTIENWVSSANGLPTRHPAFGFIFPNNGPYSFLGNILKNHGNLYGFRGIIWIQGESDFNSSETAYYNGLKELIAHTRKTTGKNIPWMVTRTSVTENQVRSQIINAQNRVINEDPNVYQGPNTDLIQVPRIDGVHLTNLSSFGISELASSLFNNIQQTSFITNTEPFQGYIFTNITAACEDKSGLKLSFPRPGTTNFKWNGGNAAESINVSSGIHQVIATDQNGNFIYSPFLNADHFFPTVKPTISAPAGNTLCVGPTGGTINFTSSSAPKNYSILWNDGSIESTHSITKNATVFAQFINKAGCASAQSNQIVGTFLPKPEQPRIITESGVFAVCKGTSVKMRIADQLYSSVLWSTGQGSSEITVTPNTGDFYVALVTASNGCKSDLSQEIRFTLYGDEPSPPIVRSGPYSLKSETATDIASYAWYLNDNLLSNTKSEINVNASGNYQLEVFRKYENGKLSCKNAKSGIFIYEPYPNVSGIKIYPNTVEDNRFYITSNTEISSLNLTLFDNLGKQHFQKALANLSTPQLISLKNKLSRGLYYLRVEADGLFYYYTLVFE